MLVIVRSEPTIHTIFTTECGEYFTWQSMGEQPADPPLGSLISRAGVATPASSCSAVKHALGRLDQRTIRAPRCCYPAAAHRPPLRPLLCSRPAGLVFSHRKAGQPGGLTRVMSCTPEEWAKLSEEQRTIVPTHVAPSYTHHPRTGDLYSAYNKPVAVIDWLARNEVPEEYVLIIDADMIIRQPFLPAASGARPGRAVSAYFSYMKGVKNRLAMKHIPHVLPRNDTLAGPTGRRSDQVGGFTLMNTKDLRRVAPLWLKFTEDVRADPDVSDGGVGGRSCGREGRGGKGEGRAVVSGGAAAIVA